VSTVALMAFGRVMGMVLPMAVVLPVGIVPPVSVVAPIVTVVVLVVHMVLVVLVLPAIAGATGFTFHELTLLGTGHPALAGPAGPDDPSIVSRWLGSQ
jgi:hypothetical protein